MPTAPTAVKITPIAAPPEVSDSDIITSDLMVRMEALFADLRREEEERWNASFARLCQENEEFWARSRRDCDTIKHPTYDECVDDDNGYNNCWQSRYVWHRIMHTIMEGKYLEACRIGSLAAVSTS